MENEKTINEFDKELICEYYSDMKRQGPGSPEMTIKALGFIDNLTQKSKIADIGCGTGGQTMVLAQNITGNIIGIDFFPEFIEILNNNANKLNLSEKVKGYAGLMENLSFQEEEFDLIWCEGAIYNIGFERGLNEWRKFLKKDGYIAVTEASWFTEKRPEEIENYWVHHYPGITTISSNVSTMQKTGYIPVATFTLPENCWIDNYFIPQISVQEKFLEKYTGNETVEEFIEGCRHEEKMYHDYKDYYGYVFYIGRKY
ncbi:MAG: methyltransferase domain-containing protein [Treponema sp.]|nr:methyltransferase domain-containing protein [Treponema sp.]